MKYKRFVYTQLIIIVTAVKFTSGDNGIFETYSRSSKLDRNVAMWNKSSEMPHVREEETSPLPNFPLEVSRCIEQRRVEIMENFSQGKNIILNCFKTNLMLNILGRYLVDSKSDIKLFNGWLEFKKISKKHCSDENCDSQNRNFNPDKTMYVKMYKKAMQKLIEQRNRFNLHRNLTEEEKEAQLNRIDGNSEAFLSEVIRNIGNEDAERQEEEKLKKEMMDPRLLSLLDALSRNYMLKLRFYPGVAARMMRSNNGGVTFDLEIQDSEESDEDSDESSTREIKDGPQAKDYFDDDDDGGYTTKKKGKKGQKKKKKEIKKKAKKLKKILPYLLLPMLIQVSLLPFVFKKLFFLAMKALFAGKVALILVGINILRNTCIEKDDGYAHKIRVEHYGYKPGEEYGAWVNGRSLPDPSLVSALSEEPYWGQKPITE